MDELTDEERADVERQIGELFEKLGYRGGAVAMFDVAPCVKEHPEGEICKGSSIATGTLLIIDDETPPQMRLPAIEYAMDALMEMIEDKAVEIVEAEFTPRTLQ